jgi:hypothetical protein
MLDVYLEMRWSEKGNRYVITDTNIKKNEIDGILEEYARSQMGKGEDNKKPNKRKIYHIRLEVDLQGDIFTIKSDTGNDALTLGILATGIGKWKFSPDLEARVKKTEKVSG